MTIFDSLNLAWRTVKGNKLRAGITIAIIAFGIMALVGILTAIDGIKNSLTNNFTLMGANSFTIRNHGMDRKRYYWHTAIGHNFRLPNLQDKNQALKKYTRHSSVHSHHYQSYPKVY